MMIFFNAARFSIRTIEDRAAERDEPPIASFGHGRRLGNKMPQEKQNSYVYQHYF